MYSGLSMRRFALLVLALLVGVAGCRLGEPPPDLLRVVDFSPRHAEVGDQLEVVGAGFPERKTATLSFRGDLLRPGRPPERNVEITAPATRSSQTRVSLLLTDELLASFCGRGPEARHTTFRGDVVVAFAARKSGAPPVAGAAHDIQLDLPAPPLPPTEAATLAAEAQRALDFLGIRVETDASGGTLALTTVDPRWRNACPRTR